MIAGGGGGGRVFVFFVLASLLSSPVAVLGENAAPIPTFPLRLVKLGGPLADPAVRAHVAWSEAAGFNGFFVYSHEAGRWSDREAAEGPLLYPEFVAFARAAAERGIRVVVSINPVADSHGTFIFAKRAGERRIASFMSMLRRRAGVRDFVLSFDDQPVRLSEIGDILTYGRIAAPAHLDLTRRLERGLPRDARLWLCAAAYCDRHLDSTAGSYAAAFLEGLTRLPARIGIVWTGPDVFSREITAEGLRATRVRLGGRKILLYDNYPVNDDVGDTLGLILGPLRGRDPSLAAVAESYLACPMTQLSASRLPLATTAAWLADPGTYRPETSWKEAIVSLAGTDPEVREALETQAMEWGGWIGEAAWRHRDRENPEAAAAALDDPAAVEAWTWTVDRYPGRMAAILRAQDAPFRDEIVKIMKRRLAIARAMPVVVEYRARVRAGRSDASAILPSIDAVRRDCESDRDALRTLDRFLSAAGIPRDRP